MRAALFLIAIAILEGAPKCCISTESVQILAIIFCVFIVMDIVDFFRN